MHFCAQNMKTLLTYLHCIRNSTPFKCLAEEIKNYASGCKHNNTNVTGCA